MQTAARNEQESVPAVRTTRSIWQTAWFVSARALAAKREADIRSRLERGGSVRGLGSKGGFWGLGLLGFLVLREANFDLGGV